MKNDKDIEKQIEKLEGGRAEFIEDSQAQLTKRNEEIDGMKRMSNEKAKELNQFVVEANIEIAKYDGGISTLVSLLDEKTRKQRDLLVSKDMERTGET